MAKSLRLFRNQTLFDTKELAITGLQAQVTTANDGEVILARYTDADDVKTLMMLVYVNGETRKYTIFDTEAVPADVTESIVGNLPDSAQYTTIEEINSALTIINGDEDTEGSIAYGDKQTYDSAVTYVNEQIQGLDVADAAVAKSFVTEVSETDGKIAVKRGAITSTDSTVTITDGADGGINLSVNHANVDAYKGVNAIAVAETADTDNKKEISLVINANDKVLSQSPDGLLATFAIAKLGTATEGFAASYQLQDKNGDAMGVTIDIPKDMVVSAGEVKTVETADQPYSGAVVGDKYIDLTIANTDDTHLYIPVKDLVDIYTAGNGIEVSVSNVISAKIDAATERFLTVGADGIKLAGVQDAINTAKAEVQAAVDKVEASVGLGTDGTFTAPAGGNYVADATTVLDAITKLDTQAKANADAIAKEVNDRTEADATLQDAIDAEEAAREAADSAINQTITSIQDQIEEITTTALDIKAGNGINIQGGAEEAKTISAVADPADTFIEVGTAGIRMKDNGVIDLGTY